MKMVWVFQLLLVLSTCGVAQLEFSLATDKTTYHYGEGVSVAITAKNHGAAGIMLEFSTCFQADYLIDGRRWGASLYWCQAFTYRYVAPHDSTIWGDDYFFLPFDSAATRLTPGSHVLVGQVSGYWTSDPISITVLGTTEVGGSVEAPIQFDLRDNYPNPFNPSTRIDFAVPKAGDITLEIRDLLGREVETLVRGYKDAGEYSITWHSGDLPGGVYFYRLTMQNRTETKRMILVK